MAITNTSKPSAPSFTNITKVISGELWSTITTSWATETRSWLDMVSDMTNTSRVTSSLTNIVKP